MRILLTDRGLTNGYTLGLADGLRRNGVEPWIGGPARSGEPAITSIFPERVPGQRARKAMQLVSGTAHFNRLLAQRPEVVHFQWPTAVDSVFALTTKRMYRLPVVYTVHNFQRAGDGRRYEEAQRRLIALADLVLTHGPFLRQAIITAHPSAAGKTHAVEHGNYEHLIRRYPRIEARKALKLPPDGPLYVFAGQIRPRKGIEILIDAFAQHRRRGGSGHLLIAGNATVPDYERALHDLTPHYADAVHWETSRLPLPQETLDRAISAANEVVLPFHDASQSGTVILAMTHGRCVVSTAAGEIPRTLRDRGIIFAPGNRSALLAAMSLAADNPDYCDELGSRGRQYAISELSWTGIAARTLRLYQSICL